MANKKASLPKKATNSDTKVVATKETPVTKYQAMCKGAIEKHPNVGASVAEFAGTFLLTLAFLEMQSSPLFVALAVAAIIFIVGGASGAHINPAVTIGAWVDKKIKGKTAVFYIVAQLLGGLAGWGVAYGLLTGISSSSTSSLLHAAKITNSQGLSVFLIELLGTFILTLGFAKVISNKKDKTTAALTGGFTVLMALYVAMSVSTMLLSESYTSLTFLNPALALAAQGLSFSWLPIAGFIIAPILGSILAFALNEFLEAQENSAE